MSNLMSYDAEFLVPGQTASVESLEQDLTSVIWQPLHRCVTGANRPILGTATDAGNAPDTDILREGLLLTKTAEGTRFTTWGSVVDFATDKIEGILLRPMKMKLGGTATNRFMGHIMFRGFAKVDGIIIPGNADAGLVGDAQEANIRAQLKNVIIFDDDPLCHK